MAPWSFLSGSGSEAEAELPTHMEADADQSRTAFTIFIDGALTNIYNEASGRSKDQRALRASLKGVIGGMQSATNSQECAEHSSGHLYTFEIHLAFQIRPNICLNLLMDPRGSCHEQRLAHFDVTVRPL